MKGCGDQVKPEAPVVVSRATRGKATVGERGAGLEALIQKAKGGRRRGEEGGLSPTAQRHHGIASAAMESREAGPADGGGRTHVKTQSKYSLLTFFSSTFVGLTFFLFYCRFKFSLRLPEAPSEGERDSTKLA